MRLLIDTSVLIDHLRGNEAACRLLVDAVRAGDQLWSVTVVRTEVLAGMRKGEEEATFALLEQLQWADVTVETADRAGALARRYLKSHPGIDTIDSIIAAAAEQLGAVLKTQNVKHFPMFARLTPAYPA